MNRAYVALVLAALSWGLALTAADAALAEISATDLLFIETAAGTAGVVVACWMTGRKVGGAWRPAVVLGSLEPGIAYMFANVGLILTSAAVGSMLFALESVFVVSLAAVLMRTCPRRVEVTALALGVLGTALVASAQSGGRSSGMGVGIMVMSTLLSAGYVLAAKRYATGHEPVALVARQGIASLVVTAPFILGASLNGGSQLDTASISCILLACLTGIIGFSVPYTLWTTSLPHVRPGFAAVALNLVPLVGVISATLLGQGGLSPGQWGGGGLILFGLVLLTRAEIAATEPTELEPTETSEVPSIPVPTIPVPAIPVPAVLAPAVPTPAVPAVPVPAAPIPAVPTVPVPAVPVRAVPVPRVPIPAVPVRAVPVPRVPVPAVPVWPAPAVPAESVPSAPIPATPLVPAIPAQRRPPAVAPRTGPLVGIPGQRSESPLERRRLRPGRAGQPVPTARQRAAARQR
jgi:drug/metabolite transporter (DMT)-like permease